MSPPIKTEDDFINAIATVDVNSIRESKRAIEKRNYPSFNRVGMNILSDCNLRYIPPDVIHFIFPYIKYNGLLLVYYGLSDRFIELCRTPMRDIDSYSSDEKENACIYLNHHFLDNPFELDSGETISVSWEISRLLESNVRIPKGIREGRNKIIKFLIDQYSSYILYRFDSSNTEMGDIFRTIDRFWKKTQIE